MIDDSEHGRDCYSNQPFGSGGLDTGDCLIFLAEIVGIPLLILYLGFSCQARKVEREMREEERQKQEQHQQYPYFDHRDNPFRHSYSLNSRRYQPGR